MGESLRPAVASIAHFLNSSDSRTDLICSADLLNTDPKNVSGQIFNAGGHRNN